VTSGRGVNEPLRIVPVSGPKGGSTLAFQMFFEQEKTCETASFSCDGIS
jgi:hypothetical protein